MKLITYLVQTWQDMKQKVIYTLIHVCSSHVFNNCCKKIANLTRRIRIRQLAKKACPTLINSYDIEIATKYWISMIIVFELPFILDRFKDSFQHLKQPKKVKVNSLLTFTDISVDTTADIKKTLRKNSPYFKYFSAVHEKIKILYGTENHLQKITFIFRLS